jgi:antirestriction protein
MAEQSAVKWLASNFPELGKYIGLGMSFEILAKFQQAERKHEQQIKEAYKHGQNNECSYEYGAEEYYNETFNK